ncbi:MAG: hypothetical protein HFF50_06515 [Lawsonibacter sp.]|nr:hypothetical protein [Lawsonibacter sp.]
MKDTEKILDAILTVISFTIGVLSIVQAIAAFREKTSLAIGRGLLWLTASGLWFANGVYALIEQGILEISFTEGEDGEDFEA